MDLDAIVKAAAASLPAPGVAISVFDQHGPLFELASGTANLDTRQPVDLATSYWDLASLTKVLVTLPEVLGLVAAGDIRMDTGLSAAWPGAKSVF